MQLERRRPLRSAEAETARPPPSVRPALTVGLRGDVLRRSKRPDLALTAKEARPARHGLAIGPRQRAGAHIRHVRDALSGHAPVEKPHRIGSGLLVAAGSRDVFSAVRETNASGGLGAVARRLCRITDDDRDAAQQVCQARTTPTTVKNQARTLRRRPCSPWTTSRRRARASRAFRVHPTLHSRDAQIALGA